MREALSAIAAMLLICATSWNAQAETGQQVAPPQDQDAVYVTIFGNESDAQYRALTKAVQTSPELQEMLIGSHYTAVPASSEMFKTRYGGTTPDLPCVRIQKADGTVILQTSGANAPHDAATLIKTMQRCPRGICPWNSSIRHRQQDAPPSDANPSDVTPQEQVNFVDPSLQATPDTQPDVEPVDEGPSGTTVAAGVAASLAAMAAGAYVNYKRS